MNTLTFFYVGYGVFAIALFVYLLKLDKQQKQIQEELKRFSQDQK